MKGEKQDKDDSLTSQDMIYFGWQIAQGMVRDWSDRGDQSDLGFLKELTPGGVLREHLGGGVQPAS